MTILPAPEPGRAAAEAFVSTHLHHLISDRPIGSPAFVGGQAAADAALNAFDVTGYASKRNEVLPVERRGASRLSPYIRHGLLQLRQVWDHVGGGPSRDVSKFRDELMWQEFARHRYARTSHEPLHTDTGSSDRDSAGLGAVWDREMACIDATIAELETDGWLVNQTRMWLASHWAIRERQSWQDGEDYFFTHLLDGSRAANRLGWQWTTGVATNKQYGFSQWQVNKRAPELCDRCKLQSSCPIADWPNTDGPRNSSASEPHTDGRFSELIGPKEVQRHRDPTHIWLTAESLGHDDPAMAAHPSLPAVFVFDEPLLARLQLSSKRLIFLIETLAEIAQTRELEVLLGDPTVELTDRVTAVTHAPVPGFIQRSRVIAPAEVHPWPWLVTPPPGRFSSFSSWRRKVSEPRR